MALDKWPCIPSRFSEILPLKLPFFVQSGAAHAVTPAKPISIIDPQAMERFDAVDKFDSFQSFCQCLRGACKEHKINPDWDQACTDCDFLVAKRLVADRDKRQKGPTAPVRYRCYMGLEEIATVVSVGGLPVMVVSGQFRPPEGLADVETAICCLGREPPQQPMVSRPMWKDISRFELPERVWTRAPLTEENRLHLLSHVAKLEAMETGFETKLMEVAQQIADIAQHYYDMATARVEAQIMQEVADAISEAATSDSDRLWEGVNIALEVLRGALNANFVAFYSGSTDLDTTLTLKGRAGRLPERSEDVVFNWRKAHLKADERDGPEQVYAWPSVSLSHRAWISRGFKAGADPFSSCLGLIPVKLSGGPFGLLVLGPHNEGADLADQESFVLTASRHLATRILTLQLSAILRADRSEWERTSRLTGHRVRTSIQSLKSQLTTIDAERKGEPGFTAERRAAAERELDVAFRDLVEISYGAESSIPGALDVRTAGREFLPLGHIIWAAVETQRDLADEQGIVIEVSDEVAKLPVVWVSPTLMRFAFRNLINNGLKYSYPRPEDRKRFLRIEPSSAGPGNVRIKVANFGLGVKESDRERIFEWGVRLSEAPPRFREVYGKGIGLWETKRIVEGHGGKVYVESFHYSRTAVTDQNIQQCITIFSVVLPTGRASDG